MLLSHVRNAGTTGRAFIYYVNRLLHAILDAACLELPNDDGAEFSVPGGSVVQGQLLEDDDDPVCVVSLLQDYENLEVSNGKKLSSLTKGIWENALSEVFRAEKMIHGHIAVKNASSIYEASFPKDIGDSGTILLLASEIAGGEAVISALKRLEEVGSIWGSCIGLCYYKQSCLRKSLQVLSRFTHCSRCGRSWGRWPRQCCSRNRRTP
jgi:uracil phosphoribosyltransferase